MPKIKLSALATDIKGKAGGSVFARNSGGLYFRNNPSGGGRKTPKWAAARSAFASLAGQWRELTPAEQDAWNAAVDNYNTTNAFGDARVPSGYELFMRLNGPLNKLGLPLLDVPQSPVALPEIGNMSLTTIEDYLFTPFTGYTPFGYGSSNQCSDVRDCDRPGETCVDGHCVFGVDNDIVDSAMDFSAPGNIIFSGLYVIPESAFKSEGPTTGLYLIKKTATGTANFSIGLEQINATEVVLSTTLQDDTNSGGAESNAFVLNRDTPVRFTVSVDKTDFTNVRFWVNGVEIDNAGSLDPESALDLGAVEFDVLPRYQNDTYPIMIQDTRLYIGDLTSEEIGKINYGYKVDGAAISFDFKPSKTGTFENYGSFAQTNISDGPLLSNVVNTFPKQDFRVRPWLMLFSDLAGVANEILIFKTTAPSSGGRIGNRVGYRRIGVVEWENKNFFKFGYDFVEEFGAVINNSTIRVEVQTLNTATGQMSEPTQIEFVANSYGLGPNAIASCTTNGDCAGGGTCIDGTCVDFAGTEDEERKFKPKFKAGATLSQNPN